MPLNFAFESVTGPILRLSGFHIDFLLYENYFCIHNFHSRFTRRIHLSAVFHRMLGFELFGYTLICSHLLYQPKEKIFHLLVNISKIEVQLSACQQIGIEYSFVLTNIS